MEIASVKTRNGNGFLGEIAFPRCSICPSAIPRRSGLRAPKVGPPLAAVKNLPALRRFSLTQGASSYQRQALNSKKFHKNSFFWPGDCCVSELMASTGRHDMFA